ncbi:MAG: FemAB family PEP-CTERM system-associated protein [Armatimonadetes bacterium]|nr:FemAB family PEP-CTERM system-associated protein [Armatimonadota bacterium]
MAIKAYLFSGGREEWDAYVTQHPNATFFHQYAWMQMIQQVYGGDPYYLAATRNDALVGVLPLMLRRVMGDGKVLVSVPFADEGGVLADNPEAEQALLGEAGQLARKVGAAYVELRQLKPIDSPELLCDTSRVIPRMPLPESVDELWQSLTAKMRNTVRRAQRENLTASIGGLEMVPLLYDVYVRHARDLGSPMHSRRFFECVMATFGTAAQAILVTKGSQHVAAALVVLFGATATLLCAGWIKHYQAVYPNNLLYWQLFEMAIRQGCRTVDLGRSPRESGVFHFKKQWGAEEHQLYRQMLPVAQRPTLADRRESRAYKAFRVLWRRMPLGLARVLGPPLFSRLPI